LSIIRRALASGNVADSLFINLFMENDTPLTPDSFKIVIKGFRESFMFIFKNKWLYLIPLFFIALQHQNRPA